MTCREFIDFLLDYFDGRLPPEVAARFNEHVRACPPCVAYLHLYEKTVKLGKGAFARPEGHCPGTIPEDLLQAILAASPARADRPEP